MMSIRSVLTRGLSILALIGVLAITLNGSQAEFHGFFDPRAFIMVFVAPILVLLAFQGDRLDLGLTVTRAREMLKLSNDQLRAELKSHTERAAGNLGLSHALKLSQTSGDSFVRYGGDLLASQIKGQELTDILARRIHAEDRRWHSLCAAVGFLAKMAPYFGMLATVIGMIHLLQNMNDFTKISGSMSMALIGTFYGLMSFLLVFSPLQKLLSGLRELAYERNEMVAAWVISVSERNDAGLILQRLRVSERGITV